MCRIPWSPGLGERGWRNCSRRRARTGRDLNGFPPLRLRFPEQVPITRRLSQRISEGDGISIIVFVDDAGSAKEAEAQGAEAVAVTAEIDGIRSATTLPLLWLGAGPPNDADAVRIRPDDDSEHDHLEAVV